MPIDYPLLVFAAFCAAVGAMLARQDVTGWGIAWFCIAAVIALQLGYLAALLIREGK